MADEQAPAERYADLPEETREFFESLRPQDIQMLTKSIDFMRSAETMGRFAKWVVVLIVGMFLSMVAVGEGVRTVFSWFGGKPP